MGLKVKDETTKTHLCSLRQVRIEMSRVYRLCKSGNLDPADGTKLVWMLGKLADILEAELLEAKVLELESAAAQLQQLRPPLLDASRIVDVR